MKDVKHLLQLCSERLSGHIKGIFIGFTIVLAVQITNWLDLIVLFTRYERLSGVMDVVWWVYFGFTAIAAVNWFIRRFG